MAPYGDDVDAAHVPGSSGGSQQVKRTLTDDGNQFTDRFTSTAKLPSSQVERFNGRTSDVVKQTSFGSAVELDVTLAHHLLIYNHRIPQRVLKHQCPIQALRR